MFVQISFQVGMDLKKVQKQGRNQRTQEDYVTCTPANTQQM